MTRTITATAEAVGEYPLFAQPERARDAALAQVLGNAGESWRHDAMTLIRDRLAGQEVLAEEFRALCEGEGIKPHHCNAWGGLTAALVRAGVIEDTGRVGKSRDPRSHARRQPVWRVVGE
jgi:hypothetical protein